jgi:hypothetical protein
VRYSLKFVSPAHLKPISHGTPMIRSVRTVAAVSRIASPIPRARPFRSRKHDKSIDFRRQVASDSL